MVLESIVGENNIRRHPILICILAFLISLGAIYFASLIFPAHASVVSVAFITIGLVPMLHNVLSKEAEEEVLYKKSSLTFFARHFDLIQIYFWVFVGIILAFSVAYAIVPQDIKQTVFEEQINAFCSISGSDACNGSTPMSISGNATGLAVTECKDPSTSNVQGCTLYILENNGGVLLFTIVLSLLYGAGAIFIIAWNASILGVFFGEMFLMGQHLKSFGFLQGMLIGHGPPELFSYVFGALAGAVLSAMISKGKLFSHHRWAFIKDVAFLSLLAFFSVIYGAATEAVGIMGMTELYFAMGFIYLLIIVVVVFFYGKREPRHNPFVFGK